MSKIVDDLTNTLKQMLEEANKAAEGKKLEGDLAMDHFVITGIAEDELAILENEDIQRGIDRITENLKGIPDHENTVGAIVTLIVTAASNSSYRAMIRYDAMLKAELDKQFENIAHHINLAKADIEGLKAALQVHNKSIGELQNKLQIDSIKKENGIE